MSSIAMKRFYKAVGIAERNGTFEVTLDGKPMRTPLKRKFALPTRALAEAVAAEWKSRDENFDPGGLKLTRLANATIDRGAERDEAVVGNLLKFAGSDLISYRAEERELAERQERGWDPILAWLADTYDVLLAVTTGINPIEQPADALAKLDEAVRSLDRFELTALHAAATITGSLALALAMLGGRLSSEEAFALSQIDEAHQAAKWGRDKDAAQRVTRLAEELDAAASFARLSRP